ncbi:MAG: hypothetical protein AVDCRST_MAG10-1477 [uncultured Acidimicrobiales bacterium]|uniref:Zinc-ribbon domain-containing protein n=1 Tax=uncultured Acidimicrobiales bacterium TaxID=310071 RepID=A0A6J4HZH3_9ACTN|nr:MAG: hypothetical protein AVDCRST_MAG10-1477 [uncultured Acidimicrobiales bacterium]
MPRFGKDKNARNEELDRQAAEEVERLTRRGGPPGMGGGGMGGGGGGPEVMASPLDMIAAEMAGGPRPVLRGKQPARKASAKPQQAFTPMPSGSVGSSFGPGGLNPGPRGAAPTAPPPAFGGGNYDEGGPVTGPPVYNAEPDEDEEITITELALMDHAAHTGHRPEDLVLQYDASSAEEMRDAAMRQFYERQQSRRPGPSTNSPFAPAGMRGGSGGGGGPARSQDPAAAGGALAQRLANRRRREEEEAKRAQAAADPAPAASPSPSARAEAADDEGALARVLARRRAALAVDTAPEPESEPDSGATLVPGPRHAGSRAARSAGLRAVPLEPEVDDDAPTPRPVPAARKAAKKAPATKKVTKATTKAPAATKAKAAPAAKARPAAKAAPAAKATKAKAAPATKAAKAKKGATLVEAPAPKATKARTTGKAKTVFCIECGEKNPAVAKFCFNCGNRLAVPEG